MMKMKNLLMVAALVLGVAISGHAVDFKANGAIKTGANWASKHQVSAKSTKGDSDFGVKEWAYTDLSFIANENLKGVVNLIYANENDWGDSDLGLNGEYGIVSNKFYTEFSIPNTGIQAKVGFDDFVTASPQVASEEMGHMQVHTPIYGDMVGFTAAYARPKDSVKKNDAKVRNSMDVYYAALPVKVDNVTVTPFYMYAKATKKAVDALTDSNPEGDKYEYPAFHKYALFGPDAAKVGGITAEKGLKAQWFGVNAAASVMDFDIAFDFDYGKTSGIKKGKENNSLRRKGFWGDLTVDYNGFANFKPAVFVGYGSGDKKDKDTNEGGIMPSLGGAQFAVGNYFYGNDAVVGSAIDVKTYKGGYMVAGIAVKDICLLDKLTHDVWAYYTKGTNSSKAKFSGDEDFKNLYLTTKDHLYHVDLTTKYQIFEELTAALELSYVDVSMKGTTYKSDGVSKKRDGMKSKNLHKVAIGLNYSF